MSDVVRLVTALLLLRVACPQRSSTSLKLYSTIASRREHLRVFALPPWRRPCWSGHISLAASGTHLCALQAGRTASAGGSSGWSRSLHAARMASEEAGKDSEENTDSTHYQSYIPDFGLPDKECITYEERYANARVHHLKTHNSIKANAQHSHSKFVVLMKLHMAFETEVPADLLVYLRSAAQETTHAGYHFFILLQIARGRPDGQRLTLEEMQQFLPIDLRPFVVMRDSAEVINHYPLIKEHMDEDWGPGPVACYLGTTNFLQQYEGYEYAWVIEYDVRWTGRNLGHFFNKALSLAQQATEEELAADPGREVRLDRVASPDLPSTFEGLPDFLAFGGISKTEKWRESSHQMDSDDLYDHWAIVYFGSRKLFQAVHERSLQGQGNHIEGFLASVAMAEGLKAASIPLTDWLEVGADYHHCCMDLGPEMYAKWYNDTKSCLPGLLLHPVKLQESWWPASTNMATAHLHPATEAQH